MAGAIRRLPFRLARSVLPAATGSQRCHPGPRYSRESSSGPNSYRNMVDCLLAMYRDSSESVSVTRFMDVSVGADLGSIFRSLLMSSAN